MHIHFLADGSPLELQNVEIELVNAWSGQIIHQEITNGTDVEITLENSEILRLNIKIQNRTLDGFSSSNLQRIPLIQPIISEVTTVEANFLENIPITLNGFDQETAFKLEKKFNSALKNMDASKFSKGVARIKENRDIKNNVLKIKDGEYQED